MKKFIHRLKACWFIFKYPHSSVIALDSKNLTELFLDKEFEVNIYMVGLVRYPFYKIVKNLSENKTDTDMILEEVSFKADVEGLK